MSFAFELLLHAIDEVESFLVENGQPNAEIIVAEKPPRRVRLAAKELQPILKDQRWAACNYDGVE